jgi:hypothetical protein
MDNSELKTLIQDIAGAQVYYERLAFDEERPHQLGEPASESALQSLEARLGAPLPADYRTFLKLHNGWQNFHADGKLLAVEDQDSGWVRKRIQHWNGVWDSEDPNPFTRSAVPIMLGESLHHFVVLDPTQIRPNGGAEIVEYDSMHKEKVYESFSAYLRTELDVLRRLIQRELHGTEDEGEDTPPGRPK